MLADDYEEKPKIKKKPKQLCSGLRKDLKLCIMDTDCVKKERRIPKDCLLAQEVPQRCMILANEFFECKRQWLDMRKRFRGNRGY